MGEAGAPTGAGEPPPDRKMIERKLPVHSLCALGTPARGKCDFTLAISLFPRREAQGGEAEACQGEPPPRAHMTKSFISR